MNKGDLKCLLFILFKVGFEVTIRINNYMKHKHHIVPKHMGGSDDPSNLIELTVEEHAEAHKKLYEENGKWQDKIAWEMLSGQIGKEEAIQEARGSANRGKKRTPEQIERIKEAAHKRNERLKNDPEKWAEINRKRSIAHIGKIRSQEHIKNNIESRKRGKGYGHTQETKKKIAESLKGNKNRSKK